MDINLPVYPTTVFTNCAEYLQQHNYLPDGIGAPYFTDTNEAEELITFIRSIMEWECETFTQKKFQTRLKEDGGNLLTLPGPYNFI